eukprot:2645576-Amphidinium_carterae.1
MAALLFNTAASFVQSRSGAKLWSVLQAMDMLIVSCLILSSTVSYGRLSRAEHVDFWQAEQPSMAIDYQFDPQNPPRK